MVKCAILYCSVAFGGVVKYSLNIARELSKLGYEIDVIFPNSLNSNNIFSRYLKQTSESQSLFKIKQYGYCYIPVKINGSYNYILDPFNSYLIARNLHHYDIIHVNDINTSFPLYIAYYLGWLKSNVMVVNHIHANAKYNDIPNWIHYFRRFYNNFILSSMNSIVKYHIATSVDSKESYLQLFGKEEEEKIYIIPNGVDFNAFNRYSISDSDRELDDEIYILFIGRDEERKGLQILIKGFNILKNKNKNTRLILVVNNDVQQETRNLIDQDSDGITVLKDPSERFLQRIAGTCDILCSPSQYGESFGLILLEGMASNILVIASNIEGYNNVVEHKSNGILIYDFGSPESWYKTLDYWINNENERKTIKSKALEYSKNMDWSVIASQIYNVDKVMLARSEL